MTRVQRLFFGFLRSIVPGVVGCLQALEALKLTAAWGTPLTQRLLLYDAATAKFHNVCTPADIISEGRQLTYGTGLNLCGV